MPKVIFKELTGTQPVLFPQNIYEKIPRNHPVRLVDSIVDQIDISSIVSKYKGGGTSSYHPRMMIKVLFYAYFSNIYSVRKIEKALQENIHFMWLSKNSIPNFRTINHFRSKRLKDDIHHLFAEVIRMLYEAGYVNLKVQYIDGTKIEAISNKYKFVWRGSVEKNKKKLEIKIKSILEEIEGQIKEDSEYENKEEIEKDINSKDLKEKINKLNKSLEKRSKSVEKQLSDLDKKHIPRLEKYEEQLETMGQRNSYSKTDPDATFMRMKDDHMKNGQLKAAYNTQISTQEQFITHYTIHQTPGDTITLKKHINSFEALHHKQSEEVVTDAGYGSEENYEYLEEKGIEAYVKYNYFHKEQKRKFKNNPFLLQNLYYNEKEDYYVCPMGQYLTNVGQGNKISKNGYISTITYYKAIRCEGCPLRSQCHKAKDQRVLSVNHKLNQLRSKAKERLCSEKGLMHRRKRSIEPEAVFGQLKSNNKFDRFSLRGLDNVNIEFGLMAIGHNLRKLMAKIKKNDNNNPLFTFIKKIWLYDELLCVQFLNFIFFSKNKKSYNLSIF